MKNFGFKRLVSLLLVLFLAFTAMPVQALAQGIEAMANEVSKDEGTMGAVDSMPFDETVLLKQYKADIDKILYKYLGTSLMSEEDVKAAVEKMDVDTQDTALMEIFEFGETAEAELTDAELYFLDQYEGAVVLGYLGETLYDVLGYDEIALYASKTVTVLDGKVSITDDNGNGSVSGGTVTITAKGSLLSKKTNNITVTNDSGAKAKISFDYSADKASSFKVAGATASATGSYSAVLEAGASISITLVSNNGFSNTTATLKLSNFSLVTVKENSNVTFEFDSELGSITVGGDAVENGAIVKDVSGDTGVALVATANSGSTFLGWVDANDMILSTSTTYTLTPAENMTVKAAFAQDGGKPWFIVGGSSQQSQSSGLLGLGKSYYYTVAATYLFDDLNAAATYAASNSSVNTLVLANNATLSAGDYTIPSGVTLLIPFDNANTMYTTEALWAPEAEKYTKEPTAYRTLTMEDGVNITVNGAISLSAKHRMAQGSHSCGGAPIGNVSIINMNSGSEITLNNGGALYAYGFITGAGKVTANSGASVYELFQIAGFRGGTQSTDMKNGVFPISQYYLQNIEVPLTLNAGAKEYACTSVAMSGSEFGSSVAFIASSGAMFNFKSGSITKDYDEKSDRLIITANGNVTVSSINMSVGTSSINSKNYELPITNNMTVRVESGTITMGQDIALLPGSKIIVEEGATCTLEDGVSMYVYDLDEWGPYNFGDASANVPFTPVKYAPGRDCDYERTLKDLKDAEVIINGTVDASKGYLYTTVSGTVA